MSEPVGETAPAARVEEPQPPLGSPAARLHGPAPSPLEARKFDLRGRSLREHAARGTMINSGFLIALSAIGLTKGFILAHFLSRADYGLMGLLFTAWGTLWLFKQVGIGDKYIQQDEVDQELAFQKAFTLELILTSVFAVAMLAALPVVADLYGQPRLIPMGLVLLTVLFAAVLQAPLWVYYRNMNFFRQRALAAIDPVLSLIVSIALAASGAGYWALVGGLFAGGWAAAIVAVISSPYRLRLRYDSGTMRSYASFSWPLFVAAAAAVVTLQAGGAAALAKVGLAGVGVFALASNIMVFTQAVDGVVTGTLYPAICAVKDRLSLLQESFVKSNRLALIWAVPFGTGVTLFSGDLIHYVLGEKWRSAITFLQVAGVVAAIGHVGFNWEAYMRATGRTRPIAVANVAGTVTFIASGLPLLFAYGIRGFAFGVGFQTVALLVCRMYYLRKLFKSFDYVRHALRALLPTVPAVAAVLGMRALEHGPRSFGMAFAELAVFLLAASLATWWFEGRLLREAFGYVFVRRTAAAAS